MLRLPAGALCALLCLAAPAQRTSGSHKTPSGSTAHTPADASGKPTPSAAAPASQPAAGLYAQEPAVVDVLDTVYHYNADGTGDRLETAVVRLQNQAGLRAYGALILPFHPDYLHVEVVYARVVQPDGSVVTTPPDGAQEQPAPLTRVAPLFSDQRFLILPIRGAAVGSRLEYQVRATTVHPLAPGQFAGAEDFGRGRVVLERSLELRFPREKTVTVRSPENAPQKTTEGMEVVYRWHGSQRAPTVHSGDDPGADTPEESAALLPPVRWSTFPDWVAVGDWFEEQIGAKADPASAVKPRTDQVLYGVRTPEERRQALFRYITRDIRTIEVPLGQGPYAAHTAAEVLQNQFGDSKDKAVLLLAMLRAAGLQGQLGLVAQGGAVDPQLPAPFWFNTVLVALPSGVGSAAERPVQDRTWLNPSPETGSFGRLGAGLRGQEVLLLAPKGASTLVQTPRNLPFAGEGTFTSKGKLSAEGTLTAHVEVALHGDTEQAYREMLTESGRAQPDRVAGAWLQAHGLFAAPRGTVNSDPLDSSGPLRLSFDVSRANFGDWAHKRIAPLQPGLELPFSRRKTSPGREIDLEGPRSETANSELLLPKGLTATLPPAAHLHTPFADFEQSYTLRPGPDGATLVVSRSLRVKQDRLPPEAWPEYRKFVEAIRDSQPPLQLSTGEAVPAAAPTGASGKKPAP